MQQFPSPDYAAISSLSSDSDGVWRCREQPLADYPDENHDHCFEVEDHSYWYAHRARVAIDLIRRYRPAGCIVDVGGGNGFMTWRLQQAGFSTVLLNPGLSGIENGQRRGLANLIHGTFEACQFAPGALAAVSLFDVLEHIENAACFLAQIRTALQRGGRLYLTVPAHRWLWSQYDQFAGHKRRYSLAALIELMEQTGYSVESGSYYFSPLLLPQILVRALPYRLGFSRPAKPNKLKKQLVSPRIARALELVLGWESQWLASGRRLAVGSSCIIVARNAPGGL